MFNSQINVDKQWHIVFKILKHNKKIYSAQISFRAAFLNLKMFSKIDKRQRMPNLNYKVSLLIAINVMSASHWDGGQFIAGWKLVEIGSLRPVWNMDAVEDSFTSQRG